MRSPPAGLLGPWTADPGALVAVAGAAVLYLGAVRRQRRARRRWPRGRTAAFLSGLAAVAVATCSGLAAYDTERFAAHAAQHVVLGMVAPLLLALGGPVSLALQAATPPARDTLRGLLRSRAVRALSHPLAGWLLFGGTLVAGYFTPLLVWSLRHEVVHAAMHGLYLVAGYLFFWPLLGVDPGRWRTPHAARLLLALLAVPFHAFAGVAMLSAGSPLAPGWYEVADQRTAGGIVWVSGGLLGVVTAGVILAQWVRHECLVERHRRPRNSPVRHAEPP